MWYEKPAYREKQQQEMEPFRYIHPKLAQEEDECRQIHRSLVHLVTHFGVQDICIYLNDLRQQQKILLPQSVQLVYDELVRLGMPVEEKGYDYKTFAKYYNK